MKPATMRRTQRLVVAAFVGLVPVASAVAAESWCANDPFAPYNGVAQPEGGQPYNCTPGTEERAGAAGPSGPVMYEQTAPEYRTYDERASRSDWDAHAINPKAPYGGNQRPYHRSFYGD